MKNFSEILCGNYEALNRSGDSIEEREEIKWSYIDSPYYCWKQEEFERVEAILLSRENIWTLDSEEFNAEYNLRLEAMEAAMKRLDQEGIFAINQERDDVIILVEVMPPDYANTERAYKMNCETFKIFAE